MTNPWGNQPPNDPYQPPLPPRGDPGSSAYSYPPPPYPGYQPMGYYQPPAHPQATTAMILGIVGLVFCGIASPFALWIGRKSMKEIDASGGRWSGRGQAQAGFVMGLIGSLFLALIVVLFGGSLVISLIAAVTSR